MPPGPPTLYSRPDFEDLYTYLVGIFSFKVYIRFHRPLLLGMSLACWTIDSETYSKPLMDLYELLNSQTSVYVRF